ncbi:MAG: STAS domain-containing protein [Acidimicrobiia bacterium]
MLLNVTRTENERGWTMLSVKGEIDIATAGILDEAIEQAVTDGRTRIAVDLEGVSFMDSTGLRTLIVAHRRLGDVGGTLAVIPGSGPIRRLLEVAGVVDTLEIVTVAGDLPPA